MNGPNDKEVKKWFELYAGLAPPTEEETFSTHLLPLSYDRVCKSKPIIVKIAEKMAFTFWAYCLMEREPIPPTPASRYEDISSRAWSRYANNEYFNTMINAMWDRIEKGFGNETPQTQEATEEQERQDGSPEETRDT